MVGPSGGVVHENGIDPEIDREQCETGIDEGATRGREAREPHHLSGPQDPNSVNVAQYRFLPNPILNRKERNRLKRLEQNS